MSHSDIERELYTLFNDHPSSNVNESGEPVIPADALVDILNALADISPIPLLSDEETTMLKTLLVDNPGLEVTPSILLQFIAEKTRHSPSPNLDQEDDQEEPQQVSEEDFWRGRDQDRQSNVDLTLLNGPQVTSRTVYHIQGVDRPLLELLHVRPSIWSAGSAQHH